MVQKILNSLFALLRNNLTKVDHSRFEFVRSTIETMDHVKLLNPVLRDACIAVGVDEFFSYLPLVCYPCICFTEPDPEIFSVFLNSANQAFNFVHRTVERNDGTRF